MCCISIFFAFTCRVTPLYVSGQVDQEVASYLNRCDCMCDGTLLIHLFMLFLPTTFTHSLESEWVKVVGQKG